MLYTIGYQKTKIDDFVAELIRHKIDLLVDVRTRPYSHSSDYNKRNLKHALETAGIEYAWEGKCLGGLSGEREPCYYERLKWLMDQMSLKRRVCVMCMEADPNDCHRGRWIAEDVKKSGLRVKHLPAPTYTETLRK